MQLPKNNNNNNTLYATFHGEKMKLYQYIFKLKNNANTLQGHDLGLPFQAIFSP